MNDASDDEDEDDEAQDVADDNTVYIVEGGQICYGSKRAWKHVAIVDRDTPMRRGKILEKSGKPQNLFFFGLMRFEPHGSCVSSHMRFQIEPQRKTRWPITQINNTTPTPTTTHKSTSNSPCSNKHIAAFPDPFADNFEFDHEKTIELRDLGIALEGIKEMFKIVGDEG